MMATKGERKGDDDKAKESDAGRNDGGNGNGGNGDGGNGDEEQLPHRRTCATEEVHLRLLAEDPEYVARRAAIENQAWRAAMSPMALARTGCTEIPVVVHVVHRTVTENISHDQVVSQIEVLNADFRRRNADVSTVPAAFSAAVGDARVQFRLATVDPDGNATNGVTRRQTTVNGFSSDNAVKSQASGGTDAWPSDRYLNIWVCRLAGGLLGYAQFPGGPAATDGVVCTHTAFGTTGTAAAPFNRGRTATHEIGHWLNLRHIWGDDGGGCNGSDFVDDTPNQAGPNTGTPTFPTISCNNGPNGDMFMNYMDYVDDAAMVMFSAGQVTRMQAALDGPRAAIGHAIDCGPKLKFADEPITLKFRDDPIDTIKFRDDPIGTVKFRDDPIGTVKFRDDPIETVKFRDDPIGTHKAVDDVKQPALDKPPSVDVVKPPRGEVIQPPDVVQPVIGITLQPGQAAPFVLATPHHSEAWREVGGGGQDVAALAEAYEQRLAEYEQALRDYAQADEEGILTAADRQEMHAVYAEYEALGLEYQRLAQGQG
jgi:hypothetical protein